MMRFRAGRQRVASQIRLSCLDSAQRLGVAGRFEGDSVPAPYLGRAGEFETRPERQNPAAAVH